MSEEKKIKVLLLEPGKLARTAEIGTSLEDLQKIVDGLIEAYSIFGRAESWCKEDGRPLEFASPEAAEAYAKECNSRTTANVHYDVKEKES